MNEKESLGHDAEKVEMRVNFEPNEEGLEKFLRENAKRKINRGMIREWENVYKRFMDGESTKFIASITNKYDREEIEQIVRIMNFMIKGGYEIDE